MNGATHPTTMASSLTISSVSAPMWRWCIAAGVTTGVVYALSPLTVVVAISLVCLCRWAVRDLDQRERRAVLSLLGAAIALRVAAVAALVIMADRNAASFATFFGDEQFYLLRAFRLYSVAMGIPISSESFLYAYDQTGRGSFQEILIFLQFLFGPVPYGIHLLAVALFLTGVVMLYRLVRVAYGPIPALVGFAYLLFLPSLFIWSVSALKEPLYLLMTSFVVVGTMAIARGRDVRAKVGALLIVVALGWWLETLRPAGRLITLGGAALGFALRLVSLRRWAIALAIGIVVVCLGLLAWRGLPVRVQSQLQASARYHRGHVLTPGHSYKLLDQRFYSSAWTPLEFPAMTPAETARYLVRAPIHFVVEPIPWQVVSRVELAYLPELVIWYCALLLVPFGLAAGVRRDALLTCVLAAFSFISAGTIALNSGNIGTLVRHRALIAPYLGWISALGLVSLLAASWRRSERETHA
jgi:hypothetical protein